MLSSGGIIVHYAHRTESNDRNEWQTLIDHLNGVGELASVFASHFNAAPWGRIAGLLHDAGKFSDEFQRRLAGAPIPVDHATAGAKFITAAWGDKNKISRILAYIIAGHHAGLADFGSLSAADDSTLARRLVKETRPYEEMFNKYMPDAAGQPLFPPLQKGLHAGMQFSMFIRMLYSCLVDADSLDTEHYADQKQSKLRKNNTSISELWVNYQRHMSKKFPVASATGLYRIRAELLKEVLDQAAEPPGLKSLTLPTGSGKTLLSLGFALKHAQTHKLRRIIFVIPYTSIIEQNAKVFRDAVGAEHVLEHHSNVQLDSDEDTEMTDELRKLNKKLSLATENWDFPIVVTTNVQFFESLFSNKRSRCRKLHNLSQSVIVLDEAQMMNGEFYKPSLYALEELTRNYGSTVVLSTATQPDVRKRFDHPVEIKELISDLAKRFDPFQRVCLEQLGLVDNNYLREQLVAQSQALCIVNTRSAARNLFTEVKKRLGKEIVFHLSARMCPAHRTKKLKAIRQRLKDKLPCILISTQLIECGVDVDFPVVYRELAGLDSIAQAAGRCNREGKLPERGKTFVFETKETPTSGWFGLTTAAAKTVMNKFASDPLSLDALQAYFDELYFYQTGGGGNPSTDKTDKHQILSLLAEEASQLNFPFATVSDKFELIQTATRPVIVGYDKKALKHLESLRHAKKIGSILRKLQPYIVQIYPQEFNAFRQVGEIVEVRERVFQLQHPDRWYKDDIGIQPFTEEYHAQELDVI